MGNPLDAQAGKGIDQMSATQQTRDHRRFRLAANDNETIVEDALDTEAHRLATNDNETIVEDELDTEAHRLAGNDNETIVEGLRRVDPDEDNDETGALGARRLRR
jgi:hypothetical protein